jgi:hypothetical protein
MKQLTMIKVNGIVNGIECPVAMPCYQKDKDVFDLINGQFVAKITQPRNLKHLDKYWKILRVACENGILDLLAGNKCHRLLQCVTSDYISAILVKKRDEAETLSYILKWMFLPEDTEILPNGEIRSLVSSISFERMDQITFNEYYNKCLELLSQILDVPREELELADD